MGARAAAVDKRLVGLVVAALLAVGGLAAAFGASKSADRVAENARALHNHNAALGATAIARATVGQAVIFAIDAELGVATPEAADDAADEAAANLTAAEGWAEALDAETAEAVDAFISTGRSVLDEIARSDPIAASDIANGELEGAYSAAETALGSELDRIAEQIDGSQISADRLRRAIQYLGMLVIPAAAIFAYRTVARRQVQASRLRMESQIEAARQLTRAKDELIASVSHEFRTPLTSIYGFSEVLLEDGLGDPDHATELVEIINAESAELSRMVEDVLTAARLDARAMTFQPQVLNVRDEIETALLPLRRAGRDATVECMDGSVFADRARLHQILRNLLSNAVKHGGGRIVMTGNPADHGYEFTVSDNGPGVPDEIRDRLFERFVHSGNASLLNGSIGLGLSIARSLSDAMGGRLTYERTYDWTRFILWLPRSRRDTPPSALRAVPDELTEVSP